VPTKGSDKGPGIWWKGFGAARCWALSGIGDSSNFTVVHSLPFTQTELEKVAADCPSLLIASLSQYLDGPITFRLIVWAFVQPENSGS